MPVNLQTFTDFAAQHTVHVAKNIHVHEADGQMEVGSASFKQTLGRDLKANQRTMAAFRSCLSERYGVFGEHAFDAVLGARADVGKTLRAKDIASVMRALSPTDTGTVRQTMIAARFANEASRQAETNPRAVAANVTGALKERLQACFENDLFFAQAVRGLGGAVAAQHKQAVELQLMIGVDHSGHLLDAIGLGNVQALERRAARAQDGAAAGEDAAKIGGRHDAEPAVDKALVAVLKTIDLNRLFAIGHKRFDNAAHGGVERLAVAATGKKTDPKHDESFRASYNMRISLPPHTTDTGVKRVSSNV